LENLPLKSIALEGDKERKIKDYNEILPVVTLVWMVDDTFGFKEDYVSYTMTPEIVLEFINNHLLWQNEDFTELLKQRELALMQLGNKTKKLDFLQKNRLVYAFQKNIVANSKKENSKYHKYLDWFELAEKTKNRLNQKSDFLKYTDDEIFLELMRRINKDLLTEEDYSYIENYEQFTERVKRYDNTIYTEGLREGERMGLEKGIFEAAKNAILAGLPNDVIKTITKLRDDQIEAIRAELG
jgi:hypothetical protein